MAVYVDHLGVVYYVTAQELAELEATALEYQHNAEAWAVGERDGVAVDSSDQTYHNNSKWYAQRAGLSAESAAEDAQLAGVYAEAAATGTLTIYARPFERIQASDGTDLLDSNSAPIYADAMSLDGMSKAIEDLRTRDSTLQQAIDAGRAYSLNLYETEKEERITADSTLQQAIDAGNDVFSKKTMPIQASDGTDLLDSDGDVISMDVYSYMETVAEIELLKAQISVMRSELAAARSYAKQLYDLVHRELESSYYEIS